MTVYRGFFVWGVGIVVVLGAFTILSLAGWPGGSPDSCIKANTCYCEAFNNADVNALKFGVRQPVNTWFNLYAILTSFGVALWVHEDRLRYSSGGAPNSMCSSTWVPDLYIFAVLFLGLGSMWFHASLRTPWSWFDGLSMFVFAAFLIAYSMGRVWKSTTATILIWLGYAVVVVLFTILNAAQPFGVNTSLLLILALVAAYLVVEVWPLRCRCCYDWRWWCGVAFIAVATAAWKLSQTNGWLCNPNSILTQTSFIQLHGLVWHPFAGGMAVMQYFYWRHAEDDVVHADYWAPTIG
jgi:hypothetical protein